MKVKQTKSFKRVVAFIVALTTIASASLVTVFAAKNKEKADVKNHIDNYTGLFPGLTDSKLRLSDPQFSSKEWYEYIDYEYYTEVKDGDMVYKIYQPSDYGEASIMAIGDYDPDPENKSNRIQMDIGSDLQGIFEMAAQGKNISKDFAGLDIASGIAKNMESIGDVMENSKYYSRSSFLGIPGDGRYKGVSNEGYFNADSLEITISNTNTVTAGKTVALNSQYTISEGYSESKDYSTYVENVQSFEKQTGSSSTAGTAISDTVSESSEISKSVSQAIGYEMIVEHGGSYTNGGMNGNSQSTSKKHTETHVKGSSTTEETDRDYFDELYEDLDDKSLGEKILNVGFNPKYSPTGAIIKTISENTGIEGISIFDNGIDIAQNENTQTEYEENVTQDEETHSSSVYHEENWSNTISNSLSISNSRVDTSQIGSSQAVGSEHSVSKNVENTKSEVNSIGNALTNGSNTTTGQQNQKDMAVGVGYGADYQIGNELSNTVGVTRVFSARDDKEVRNVGWKLCEYVVRVPYYIEAEKSDGTVLYGQYVNYNLLKGVCRVFANGYIEHWYTGELVTYDDFFEGFVTASELVDKAKAQQAAKADLLG